MVKCFSPYRLQATFPTHNHKHILDLLSRHQRLLLHHLCLYLTAAHLITSTFLQGVSTALLCKPCTSHRRDVCLSVRPSDRPSDTRWYWVKTTQARITKSSPTDSPRTLVFGLKTHPENRTGSPRARALNESGVGKICYFQPISHRISESFIQKFERVPPERGRQTRVG